MNVGLKLAHCIAVHIKMDDCVSRLWRCTFINNGKASVFEAGPFSKYTCSIENTIFFYHMPCTRRQPLTPHLRHLNLFSIEAQTQVGRSHCIHNLEDLFVCECGSLVAKTEIERKVSIIQCKKTDCLMRWVSKFYNGMVRASWLCLACKGGDIQAKKWCQLV